MSKIKLLEAAKMFAAERLNAYFEYEDYYCATDSRLLVMVPKDQIPEEEITIKTDNVPNFSFVLSDQSLDGNVKLKLGDLIDKLNQVPMVDEFNDCYDCDGDGGIECHCCGNITECNSCHGTGQGEPTGTKELDYNYHLKVMGCCLNVTTIQRLTTALIESGYSTDSILTILSHNNPKPIIMGIDGIIIVSIVTNKSYIEKEKLINVL